MGTFRKQPKSKIYRLTTEGRPQLRQEIKTWQAYAKQSRKSWPQRNYLTRGGLMTTTPFWRRYARSSVPILLLM